MSKSNLVFSIESARIRKSRREDILSLDDLRPFTATAGFVSPQVLRALRVRGPRRVLASFKDQHSGDFRPFRVY
jgi:hypothetical protein